jgi:PadR family transcriptional regulator AphA
MSRSRRTPTTFAILGQLALRPSRTYELAKRTGRNLRFFWPSAESRIYEQVKLLVDAGLATAQRELVGRRPRTTYSITDEGRSALADWLAGDASGATHVESEDLMRVFFGTLGSDDDLVAAIRRIGADTRAIQAVGRSVAEEYLDGRAEFQDQVRVRALVFDFLWAHAAATIAWAERAEATVQAWPATTPDARDRAALELFAERLASTPADLGPA